MQKIRKGLTLIRIQPTDKVRDSDTALGFALLILDDLKLAATAFRHGQEKAEDFALRVEGSADMIKSILTTTGKFRPEGN